MIIYALRNQNGDLMGVLTGLYMKSVWQDEYEPALVAQLSTTHTEYIGKNTVTHDAVYVNSFLPIWHTVNLGDALALCKKPGKGAMKNPLWASCADVYSVAEFDIAAFTIS